MGQGKADRANQRNDNHDVVRIIEKPMRDDDGGEDDDALA
jgi:hypothetical protein